MQPMLGSDNKLVRYMLQAVNYTVFMALIWYFSTSPAIRVLAEDQAMITLAFGHAGETREPCRKVSAEDLAKLAPNMRMVQDCPRERSPVVIQMTVDGRPLIEQTLKPPGIFKDGGVDVYFSGRIPAGEHVVEIKMDDSVRQDGFNHSFKQSIEIEPGTILLLGFDSEKGFVVK